MAADDPTVDDSTDVALLRQVVDDVVTGVPAASLAATVRELGWPAVGVAESAGGSAGTLRDAATLVRAAAGAAPELPLVPAMQANWLLAEAGWLVGLRGEPPAVVAAGPGSPVTLTGDRLDGTVEAVAAAASAATLLVVATVADDGRAALAVVDRWADGVRVDPGLNLAAEARDTVTLHGCVPQRVVTSAPPLTTIRTRESLLIAAALLGVLERTCRLTLDHVRVRTQFGRPLLAQQAVAHAVATMAGERELSRAAFGAAMDAWDRDAVSGSHDAPVRVAAARVVLATAATTVARLAHQLHGAVGVTREHPLHRCTGRLLAWRDEPDPARTAAHILGKVVTGGGDLWQWAVTDRAGG